MRLALSTRWNASRHASGEALCDEVLQAGFQTIEIGYDLHPDLLPGLLKRVHDGTIRVCSLHAPCPIPLGFPSGNPEYFTLADPRDSESGLAIQLVQSTLRLAAEVGASAVVVHAGRVAMPHFHLRPPSPPASPPGRFARWWDHWRRHRMQTLRARYAPLWLDSLKRSLEILLPDLEATGVVLALENLPSFEAVPSESEMHSLLEAFRHPRLGYWHDIGHGFYRQRMGFAPQQEWLNTLKPWLVGLHVHDVSSSLEDHLEPGAGEVSFADFVGVADGSRPLVIEVRPGVPTDRLQAGVQTLIRAWPQVSASTSPQPENAHA